MSRPDPGRYGPAGPTRGRRLLALLVAGVMVVLGALWTAQAYGVIGDSESRALGVLGPLVAGFGVALAWVVVRPRP